MLLKIRTEMLKTINRGCLYVSQKVRIAVVSKFYRNLAEVPANISATLLAAHGSLVKTFNLSTQLKKKSHGLLFDKANLQIIYNSFE